ncbi:hypothetical protein E2C01_035130 [Portunus trituberculatus]|uniref:Major facilitator superfamily associated domain-containing protein n=1 Tax=Portunus trituberculatus TaxID=210409 RepID=A0A5B7F4R7_PORTR|nr:hypothetical protein [Portunus trituberculatus]
MQEEMAVGTSAMNHMKFLQGMTIFVQCGIEAPFMFINSWFMKTLGAHYVTSLVFFLYIFRLLGLAVVGAYGPVWATLLVELLNGPCYGLGYTAIVIFSSKLSPPGTSTTVQSIVNICYEILGYAAASFFGGHLFSRIGGPGLYLVGGITALIIFFLHLLSLKLLPPPEEHTEEEKSLENHQPGEEEKLSPDPETKELNESSTLTVRVEEEQETSQSPTIPKITSSKGKLKEVFTIHKAGHDLSFISTQKGVRVRATQQLVQCFKDAEVMCSRFCSPWIGFCHPPPSSSPTRHVLYSLDYIS